MDHGRRFDELLLPFLVVADQLDGLAGDRQAVRRERLAPNPAVLADAVPSFLKYK